ncbi:MAG TPA: molybdopterin-binding protein [Candidatus Eisenbacteria bacterium]|nr:molybdopterin-binding protein [Candidatus Eisenbacteria bacterium]
MASLLTAELLSVGTELTIGETRDTNAGDLARELTARGVVVGRVTALPDDLATVQAAFADAMARSDIVISTGGLGPTPDDLTREAIAAALGETPVVDAALERWLHELFERRGLPLPQANLKQAWLIPSATSIPNANGTAPGWWIEHAGGGVVTLLPGPPREMRPMWDGWVLPRLTALGLGQPMAVVTLRTTGIGESLIADRLGPLLDRAANPTVATYARADSVDIRISALPDHGKDPQDLLAAVEARIIQAVGEHVWARGPTAWPEAVAAALAEAGWRISIVEVGLRGALIGLLGEGLADRLAFAEALGERPRPHDGQPATLEHLAGRVRELGGSEVGLAVEARPRRGDTAVSIVIVDPAGRHRERRIAFLGGQQGRSRAAIAAAAVLLKRLRSATPAAADTQT